MDIFYNIIVYYLMVLRSIISWNTLLKIKGHITKSDRL